MRVIDNPALVVFDSIEEMNIATAILRYAKVPKKKQFEYMVNIWTPELKFKSKDGLDMAVEIIENFRLTRKANAP
jgi:hypothetical protein